MISKVTLALGAIIGASVVNAHQKMVQPVPYNSADLNNSPLMADGSDFPCKLGTNTFSVTTENIMVPGESQELAFIGSATHGGGSCQVSLTTDREPTKDSKWSVIKSYEGGCVANVDGNLNGDATLPNPYTFNFTIPDSVAPGQYTLAWTWFNHVGAREMYMNCAPVTVPSSSSKRSEPVTAQKRALESFPDMFIANINGCMTSEGEDIRFPYPGDDVEFAGEPSNLAPVGKAACTGTPQWGGAGITGGSGGAIAAPTATAAATTSAKPSLGLTVAVPEFTATTTTTTTTTAFVTTTTTTASIAPAETSSAPETSSSGVLSGPCTDDSLWNCIDGTSFQRCASGAWTPTQPVAAGTECVAGISADFTIKLASLKPRMLKDMRRHRRAHTHA